MWHHSFVTIVNMTNHWFFLVNFFIILQIVLIYICDVKLVSQKQHQNLCD